MAPRDSSYTQDVIARGMAAVRDRRNGQGANGDMQGAFSQMLGGLTNHGPGNYQINYGQTSEGDYSGFKNASDLWNAVEGQAAFEREQDQLKAQAMQQLIDKRMGYIENGYNGGVRDLRTAAIDETTPMATVAQAPDMGRVPLLQVGQQGWQQNGVTIPAGSYQNAAPVQKVDDGGYQDLFGGGHGGTDSAGQVQGDAIRKHIVDNSGELNKWLATTTEPYQQALDTLAQVQQAPITDYTAMAGAQYGVDPNIIRGKYDDQAIIKDFRTQRDLQSLQENGVPYYEAQRALQQAQQQGEQQQQDQMAADEQGMIDEVMGLTSIPGDQLAKMANSDLSTVYDTVRSQEYQDWARHLEDAISQSDGTDQTAIDDVLNGALQIDPSLYRILVAQYQDLTPRG